MIGDDIDTGRVSADGDVPVLDLRDEPLDGGTPTEREAVGDKDDNRRGMLQGEALKFLMRERDVKNYSDIFSQIHSY